MLMDHPRLMLHDQTTLTYNNLPKSYGLWGSFSGLTMSTYEDFGRIFYDFGYGGGTVIN